MNATTDTTSTLAPADLARKVLRYAFNSFAVSIAAACAWSCSTVLMGLFTLIAVIALIALLVKLIEMMFGDLVSDEAFHALGTKMYALKAFFAKKVSADDVADVAAAAAAFAA